MKKQYGTVAILAFSGALLLAGCSATGGPSSSTSSSPTTSVSPQNSTMPTTSTASSNRPTAAATKSATPTPTVEATGNYAACAEFIGDGDEESLMARIPAALNGLTGSGPTAAESQQEMLLVGGALKRITGMSDGDLKTALQKVSQPFLDFADVYFDGGGHISLDTSTMLEDVTEVLRVCAEQEGYKVPGS